MSKRLRKLEAAGFTLAQRRKVGRLILSLVGLEASGKTHLALTAPDPIAYMSLDLGDEGVVDKFTADKTILSQEFRLPVKAGAEEYAEVWRRFDKAYKKALESEARTIIWDTATDVWELMRMAEFGKLTQVMPVHYGPVNAKFRALIDCAYHSDKNLILLHKMKEKYKKDKPTGEMERAGQKETGYKVQAELRCEYAEGEKKHRFSATVVKSRMEEELVGKVYKGKRKLTFAWIAHELVPGTEPEDWGEEEEDE